jgi:hypothetical protein
MSIAERLDRNQIDAAGRLGEKCLPERQLAYSALDLLHKECPSFEPNVCLLKSAAVNDIFGTKVLAIVRVARHAAVVLAEVADRSQAGVDLVGRIADVHPSPGKDQLRRRHTSFASKFCHFFVDAERFPIYDNAALEALKLHFDKGVPEHEYETYCACIAELKESVGNGCDTRMLDNYLLLTGMCQRWLKQREKGNAVIVNAELLDIFEHPTEDQRADLNTMLPKRLEHPFTAKAAG